MKLETLLPIAAPTPAGLVIAIRLYQEILAAVGTHDIVWQVIATIGAGVGCIGMIGAEMYAYKQAGLALAERQVGAAIAALVAALVCSSLIVWSIGTGDNTRPLISAVIVAIAAYVVLALRDFLARKKSIKQDQYARVDEQNKQVLALEKQKTNQANAAARLAKVQGGQVLAVQAIHEQRERVNSRAFPPEKISEIRAYRQANPNAPVRQVAAACGVSVGSAAKYG